MANVEKGDWQLRVAVAAAAILVIVLVVGLIKSGFPVFSFAMFLLYIIVSVFLLVILWRAMRAHERLADALTRIAQRQERDSQ